MSGISKIIHSPEVEIDFIQYGFLIGGSYIRVCSVCKSKPCDFQRSIQPAIENCGPALLTDFSRKISFVIAKNSLANCF